MYYSSSLTVKTTRNVKCDNNGYFGGRIVKNCQINNGRHTDKPDPYGRSGKLFQNEDLDFW